MTLQQALVNNESAANEEEAKRIMYEMLDRVMDDGEDPEEILMEYGLEPDYVMDLLGGY